MTSETTRRGFFGLVGSIAAATLAAAEAARPIDATDAAGLGTSPDRPLTKISDAVARCTGSRGEVIYVMSGGAK